MSFPFWFTDIVSALDTLSRLGLAPRSAPIAGALNRVSELQHDDRTFALKLLRDKDKDVPWWICLAVYRSPQRWSSHKDSPGAFDPVASYAASGSGCGIPRLLRCADELITRYASSHRRA